MPTHARRAHLRGDLRRARRRGAARGVRDPARRDAGRGCRAGGLRARVARLGPRRAPRAARPLPEAARPQPRARPLAPHPFGERASAGSRRRRTCWSRSPRARRRCWPAPPERRLARAAVRRLPEEQRQAIGLAYWGGLSTQELAAVEGIPLGSEEPRAAGAAQAVERPRAGGGMSTVVLTQSGELDIATIPGLMRRLEPHRRPGAQVVLDLREVVFMDCFSLGHILGAHADSATEGWTLCVRAWRPRPSCGCSTSPAPRSCSRSSSPPRHSDSGTAALRLTAPRDSYKQVSQPISLVLP